MPNLVQSPFPLFADTDGDPLENGYIYIGQANLNPIANPISAYWDSAMTVPAVQPIRTKGGYPVLMGSPKRIYVPSNYSILVRNKNGALVCSNLDSIDYFNFPSSVETIAALRALVPSADGGYPVQLLGYYAIGDGGGGPLRYWDATSVEADNGGSVIAPTGVATGRWKFTTTGPADVKWYGAKGDGIADDTAEIQAALDAHNLLEFQAGTYKTTAGLTKTLGNDNVTINGNGAKIDYLGAEVFAVINFTTAAVLTTCDVKISGFEIDGNDKANNGISFFGAGKVNKIFITKNNIYNMSNIAALPQPASTAGILTFLEHNIMEISHNEIDYISRTQSLAGTIASRGIAVFKVKGIVDIHHNSIANIQSPVGSVDADGMFIQDLVLNGKHKNSVNVSGNTFTNCKGRSIKIQCSQLSVHGNTFNYAAGDNISTDANVIDDQSGNANVYCNEFNIYVVTNAATLRVYATSFNDPTATGADERCSLFHDNLMYINQTIENMCILVSNAGAAGGVLHLYNNTVKTLDPTKHVSKVVGITLAEPTDRLDLLIHDNEVPVGDFKYLLYFNSYVAMNNAITGPAISAKLFVSLYGNRNNLQSANACLFGPLFAPGSGSGMYMQYVFVKNNVQFPNWACDFKGCDVKLLPTGTEFYFDTDTSGGGMVNAPAGFGTAVHISSVSSFTVNLQKNTSKQICMFGKTGATQTRYLIAREYLNAAPVAGTYTLGEITWNSEPATGEPAGWICTVAGTPGTWKAFGTIS